MNLRTFTGDLIGALSIFAMLWIGLVAIDAARTPEPSQIIEVQP